MADGPKLATAYYELIAAAPGAEKQITDIRYRSLITTAALIEYERIGNILQELDDHQLPLIPATEPPYLLVDSGQHPVVTPPLARP